MLLFTHSPDGSFHYIAQQRLDYSFNRIDTKASSEHRYGRKWIKMNRWMTGPQEWTQVGPLNMVQWSR